MLDQIQTVDTELCRVCEIELPSDEVQFRNRSEQAICEDCQSEHYFLCGDCGYSVRPEYFNHHTDLCSRCTNENFNLCVDCDNYVRTEESYWSEYDSNTRCDYCHWDHVSECENGGNMPNVFGYHHGAPWGIVFHNMTSYHDSPIHTTYYGVELECEYVDSGISDTLETMMSKRIGHAETDSSLNEGIEFITQPATLGAWRYGFGERVSQYMARVLDHGGSFAQSTCGAHVHVSRTAFDNESHLARFITFMRHNEQFILAISGRETLEQWAKVNAYRSGDMRREIKSKRGDRYRAVNLNNEQTIEVRAFAGSDSFADILGSIEFIDALINYTRDLSISDINIGALFADSFITWLNDPELSNYPTARALIAKRYTATN